MRTFDQWWDETYAGKLGGRAIDLAFREVAHKAWYSRSEEIAQFVEDKFDFVGGEIVIAEAIREHE